MNDPEDASMEDASMEDAGDGTIVCDPEFAAVYATLSGVRSGCAFAVGDRTAFALLTRHIFNQPAPPPVPEGDAISICDIPNLAIDFVFLRPDGTVGLCPAYCTVLETWLVDHEAQSRACLPDSL
jgi:hypothetical protein